MCQIFLCGIDIDNNFSTLRSDQWRAIRIQVTLCNGIGAFPCIILIQDPGITARRSRQLTPGIKVFRRKQAVIAFPSIPAVTVCTRNVRPVSARVIPVLGYNMVLIIVVRQVSVQCPGIPDICIIDRLPVQTEEGL